MYLVKALSLGVTIIRMILSGCYHISPKLYDAGYRKIVTLGYFYLSPDDISAVLMSDDGLKYTPVKDTPHFEFISGNSGFDRENCYVEYKTSYFSELDIVDQVENFLALRNSLVESSGSVEILVGYDNCRGWYIKDGLHRCSILMLLNVERIKCRM